MSGTDRAFGFADWYGEVVNVNDPDQEGRVQIRIHGLYDDKTNIPDDQLPWVKPLQMINSAGHNKIGETPVGVIKGSIVGGYFVDNDKQYPIFSHVIAKAGDPQPGTTVDGQTELIKGTNSTPIADRNKNNKFVTRKGKNIKEEDNASEPPKEAKDSDGVDITAEAAGKTKFSKYPTVGSVQQPSGSILNQLTQVDPTHLTSVLPQAVEAFKKIKDLNTFSSTGGVMNVLGQVLGSVLNAVGAARALNAMSATMNPSDLSPMAQNAILIALENLGSSASSDAVQAIIGSTLEPLLAEILALLNSGNLTAQTFNDLIARYFASIQQQGQQSTVGVNLQSILQNLTSVLPQLAQPLQETLNIHLPTSTLNVSTVTQALQKFAMSQAFLKKPGDGKKALAILATTQGTSGALSALASLPGISDIAQKFMSDVANISSQNSTGVNSTAYSP